MRRRGRLRPQFLPSAKIRTLLLNFSTFSTPQLLLAGHAGAPFSVHYLFAKRAGTAFDGQCYVALHRCLERKHARQLRASACRARARERFPRVGRGRQGIPRFFVGNCRACAWALAPALGGTRVCAGEKTRALQQSFRERKCAARCRAHRAPHGRRQSVFLQQRCRGERMSAQGFAAFRAFPRGRRRRKNFQSRRLRKCFSRSAFRHDGGNAAGKNSERISSADAGNRRCKAQRYRKFPRCD